MVRGARAPLLQMAGHEGHCGYKNKKYEKLAKLYWPSQKGLITKTNNCRSIYLYKSRKVEGHDQKQNFSAL